MDLIVPKFQPAGNLVPLLPILACTCNIAIIDYPTYIIPCTCNTTVIDYSCLSLLNLYMKRNTKIFELFLTLDKKEGKKDTCSVKRVLPSFLVKPKSVASDKDRRHITVNKINVLFNDAINTFYLRLYGVRHMVKDHSDSERGNPLPPHGLLFPIRSKRFLLHHPTDRLTHTTAFVTPVVEHWLE